MKTLDIGTHLTNRPDGPDHPRASRSMNKPGRRPGNRVDLLRFASLASEGVAWGRRGVVASARVARGAL